MKASDTLIEPFGFIPDAKIMAYYSALRETEAEVAQLRVQLGTAEAELSAAKEDAARYHHLRVNWDNWTGTTWGGNKLEVAKQLDAAIDNARKAQP